MYVGRNRPKSQYKQFVEQAPQRLEGGYYDQANADRQYAEQSQPIDSALYGASRSLAADYASRGLDTSGLSAGAQVDASLKAAAAKRLAKANSIDSAQDDYRQGASAAWGVLSGDRSMNQTDEQLRRLKQQQDQMMLQQSLAGLGNVAGLFMF